MRLGSHPYPFHSSCDSVARKSRSPCPRCAWQAASDNEDPKGDLQVIQGTRDM